MAIANLNLLNLPAMPESLIAKIIDIASTMGHDSGPRHWLNKFHMDTINSVNQQFADASTIAPEINEIYSPYFNQSIIPLIGVMRNVTDQPACLPPHCDRARFIAINYIIELGGPAVRTCFYDYFRIPTDPTTSENIPYDKLSLTHSEQLDKHTWYNYNVQQCHSVENVATTRIFLGLILEHNPTFDQFCQTYSNLIKEH